MNVIELSMQANLLLKQTTLELYLDYMCENIEVSTFHLHKHECSQEPVIFTFSLFC